MAQTPTIDFDYNWDGKLRSATIGSDSIELKYDPMGNRVYKASSTAGNRRYIVDISGGLPTILMEVNVADYTITRAYIYANSQILAQKDFEAAEPNRYFYIHDRLGSVRLVINQAGDVNNSYTYNPFGEDFATECTETTENPFKFTGQWYDSEIGQYYLRARMYNPELMRFTGRDPVQGKYQEPLTLHRYLYCINDPVDMVDPSGHWLVPAAAVVVTVDMAAYALLIYATTETIIHHDEIARDIGGMYNDIKNTLRGVRVRTK